MSLRIDREILRVCITLRGKSRFRKIDAGTCFAAHSVRDEFLRLLARADRRDLAKMQEVKAGRSCAF